ncbi:MAG TPA: SDR family oxidoreductase [Conexibacter sp.]
MVDLVGRTAICTGATSGIGRASALALAAAGANVVAVGRDEARLAAVVAEIERAGGRAAAACADLVEEGAPEAVVATAVERFGGVDVVASCAGVYESAAVGQADLDTVAVLDRLWAMNARAPYRLVEAALPQLGEGSSIVLFSSTMSRFGIGYGAAYSMTKAAIDALTRVLSVELGPRGVRVNAVSPGWVKTPMNEAARADPGLERFAESVTPLGRWAQAEEIADVVVFLASDLARYVHGTIVQAEGGYPALPSGTLADA